MKSDNQALTSAEESILREIVARNTVPGAVIAVIGELSGDAAKVVLGDIAQADGRMICVNSFPDVLDGTASGKRNPNQVTREEFLRFVRKSGYRESVMLVNGDAADLAALFARESVDLLFLACRGGYEAQRSTLLAWYPVLRQAGILFGRGFVPSDPADGYAGLVVGSETSVRGAPSPQAVARMVSDMVPRASVCGRIWVADKGLADEPIAVIAAGMQRARTEGNRLERKHRSLLKRALQIGESAESRTERIGMLEQLTRDFPQYLEPHLMLGEQFLELNLVDEAIRVYERSLKNRTGNAGLYSKLGVAHKAKGDVGAAEAYLLASLRCDRTHLPSWLSLAMLYVERGDAASAVDAVAHGLDVCPPELEQVVVLCRMSQALGEQEILAKSLQLLRRLDPDHELVDKLSKRISSAESRASAGAGAKG